MKALSLFTAFLIAATSASASIYQDTWIVTGTEVSPSMATKADGSKIAIPGEFNLILSLKTKSEAYGVNQRWIKEQTVVSLPTANQPGIINIVVESATDFSCSDHLPEVSLGMMGSDSSSSSVLVQAGKYYVILDGQLAGSVDVVGEGQGVFIEDAGYAKAINQVNWQRLDDALSGLDQMGLNSEGIKVSITKTALATYNVDYWFSEVRTLNESTGEFYVAKEELKGSATFPESTSTYLSCDGSKELTLRTAGGELEVYITPSGEKYIHLSIDGRSKVSLKSLQ